jgi:hypothetical protein
LFGLFGILVFSTRIISLSWNYGVVELVAPIVLPGPLRDEELSAYASLTKESVTDASVLNLSTKMMVLTHTHLLLGTVEAFTRSYLDRHSKKEWAHVDGAVQMAALGYELQKSVEHSVLAEAGVRPIVFLPNDEVPLALVIQIIHYMQTKTSFGDVVLGQGLM